MVQCIVTSCLEVACKIISRYGNVVFFVDREMTSRFDNGILILRNHILLE